MAQRILSLSGHLIDTGLMSEVMDRIADAGARFEMQRFAMGRTRSDVSQAQFLVVADDPLVVDALAEFVIGKGGVLVGAEETDARLVTVEKDGVASDDFYSTTIYRTEVRVKGRWLPVAGQRMDVILVVDADALTASCRLIRDLKAGETIICGVEGIRTFPPEHAEGARVDGDADPPAEEFGFMSSSVSSERRVELAVNEIADDLRRIRDAGGKTVVVPGPVVVHTGGGPYLASLIREGYIHALLGGNAIATHDIEQALFGTSLGVNLERGRPVHEGHKHHLRAINLVRGYGSIAAAVEAGAIPGGVMVECVRRGIPYVLAGSIRDDGPLPDTRMDLVQAQNEYQEVIRGASLILMLSTMLHSIGVGNMTPAGVKLVCVDINPAVVTKLADRGSIESVGIVTDVGLFLRLLAGRLGLA